MEDCNDLAADCIIVSCCCQCLILQVLILVLLKLPYKLMRKLKEFISQKMINYTVGSTPRISMGLWDCGCCEDCIRQAEMVLEDLCKKGGFAFGSFWGRRLFDCRTPGIRHESCAIVVGIGEAWSIHDRNSSSSGRLVRYA